jgi:[protein-PII] uridylyltransferase
MQDLLAKIEANAASRLALPPGRHATQELGRYKAFLKVETHRLKILHRAGGEGLSVCRSRAAILDVLLRYLWDASKATLSEEGRKEFPPIALVAIGGYGRAELNPYSDIDFMFLQQGQIAAGKPLPYLSRLIDGILYPLWDINLKVGHSVRSVEDCVRIANTDMQSKTSLIEARLVTGDEGIFRKFQKVLVAKCVEGHVDQYLAMRLADQAERRSKFGNSACMQEPNVKNGCGGLRDYQNLLWMAFFKYRTRSLPELQSHGLISASERKQLEAAYDFLLRTRTEMHYQSERGMDVLTKNMQPAVAHSLGYRDRSPSKRIEVFMRDLYTHARSIFLITRTIERRLALMPAARPRLSLKNLLSRGKPPEAEPVDGFRFVGSQIHAVSPRVFREQPRRLMRVFLYAQQRGAELHPDLAQLVRQQLSLVNRGFLGDAHVRETFLTILDQRGNVARTLRAMHDVDFLGKYMPEFGKLTCLVQHEFYHQYAADEHTLMCVEQLDKVWEAKEAPYQQYAPLLQGIERPAVLYLALLLHDTGKPTGHGRHTAVSSELALRVARRLGLDGATAHVLRLIIDNHLLLASVSQRRDLDDPAVTRSVAKHVQTPDNLRMLTLHTFVDSVATSDKLWNGFKDSLLWTLHHRTMEVLTGRPEFARAEEIQREVLRAEVKRLMPPSLSTEELDAHFIHLPARYFQIHTAREILDDLVLAHLFMRLQISEEEDALVPVVNWHNDPDRACNTVKVCTWDRAGLFSKIAGSFSAAGLSILTAQVFSRTDGIVLDTFSVLDAKTGNLAGPDPRKHFQEHLNTALNGEEVDFTTLIGRQKIARPPYQAYTGERIPTHVRFDNEASETRTLIEVETEDRLGVLYAISQAFADLNLDISAAKILTERGAVIDTFYVRELDGAKVVSNERLKIIERRLRQAIHILEQH